MPNTTPIVAVLDANILYPALLRDFLLTLAMCKTYMPKWSAKINEEWTRNLLLKRSDLKKEKVLGVVSQMNKVFPFSEIEDFENFIPSLELPDADDRHVLAAAIKTKATIIITANLRDFPEEYIRQFDIEVLHPDELVMRLLESAPQKCLLAFHKSDEENAKSSTDRGGIFAYSKEEWFE